LLIHGGTGNDFIFDLARSLLPPHWSVLPADILHGMCSRYSEFTEPQPIRVAVGTYNVNGGHHFRSVVYKDSTLADWLLDSPHQDSAAAR
jgi:phosphatidylinositol-bisphosphatase